MNSSRKLYYQRHTYVGKILCVPSLIAASHFVLNEMFQLVEEKLHPTIIPVTCACCAEGSCSLESFLCGFIARRVELRMDTKQGIAENVSTLWERKCTQNASCFVQTICAHVGLKSVFSVGLLQLVYHLSKGFLAFV